MISNREIFLRHLGQTSPEPMGLEIVKAQGVKLFDVEGKDYFDLISGVSVANLGHANPVVAQAVKEQIDKYMHLMVYGEFIEEPQVKLVKLLAEVLPEKLNSSYLVNSGSEAVEGAMKLAKRYTGRYEIVSFENAYHGSTHGALSLMSDNYFTNAFRPLVPGVKHLEFNNIRDLDKITEATACVIVEPIQGEGGIISPEKEFLPALRQKCDETGALLIFDEIQTGFGRTGALFAFQKYDVVPDILLMAKALGGGMPIGAFSSSKEIMDSFMTAPVLGHITTFGGHPVSSAAAFSALKYLIDNKEIISSVEEKEALFVERISGIKAVEGLRHNGLFMAVDLGSNKALFSALKHLRDAGVHTDWFLFDDHSFRIAPPLIISLEEINEVCDRIDFALEKL